MDAFLTHLSAERLRLCEAAGEKLGLQAASIEKDFWICWTLRELFALTGLGTHLTFKGGTSLSKCWQLIQRFSEDIDVVIDRHIFGFDGDSAPEKAHSHKERERRLEHLRKACQDIIHDQLQPALLKSFRGKLPKKLDWKITPDPDDRDRQTILFQYPSVFPSDRYLRPVVKIELGARSDTEPSLTPSMQPYIAEALPKEFTDSVFCLRTVAPERTFWEKAMLLHEETYRVDDNKSPARLARHYYDLWCLIRSGVGERALLDLSLFPRVAAHRAIFFRKRKEAQESLRRGSLRLLPQEKRRSAWRQDYEAMREAMIFGDSPDFAEILRVVGDFEHRFNQAKSDSSQRI